jgi:hypothetical protein
MGDIYERGVKNAELPKLSPALWKQLKYLGRLEQDCHALEKNVKQLLEDIEKSKEVAHG